MSDPVTNAEVEDVLSSIRRLVSEDKRPMQAPKTPEPSDRLVLTPALRVMENEAPAESAQDEPPQEEQPRPPAPSLDSLITNDSPVDVYGDGPQENILEFDEDEPEVAESPSTLEDDYSDDPYSFDEEEGASAEADDAHLLKSIVTRHNEDAPDEIDDMHPPVTEQIGADWDEDVADTEPALGEPDHGDHADSSDDTVHEDHADSSIGTVHEDHTDDADRSDDVELADHSEPDALQLLVQNTLARDRKPQDDPAASKPEARRDGDHANLVTMPERDPAAETAVAAEEPASDPATSQQEEKTIALSTKIAALETAIGKIAGTWEPDDPGESAYAGTEPEAMEWEDDEPLSEEVEVPAFAHRYGVTVEEDEPEDESAADIEAGAYEEHVADRTAAAPPAAEPAADSPADEPAMGLDLGPDEQIIDEEMLRDLVSDIVRAELQGALGERITRNVRKLVRREIHRALTAQDLE